MLSQAYRDTVTHLKILSMHVVIPLLRLDHKFNMTDISKSYVWVFICINGRSALLGTLS